MGMRIRISFAAVALGFILVSEVNHEGNMRSGERDPIDPLQAEGVRGAQAPCRKSVSATTHPAPPNQARAPSGAVTRIHRGRMAIPMPPSRPRPTTASLTNSHRAGSDVVGGCMQSSRTSSKRPRLQVKAGMRLAARTSPNANSTPRAQAYRELPEGSTGRRRIRHQMATPTPTLTTDAIVSSAAPRRACDASARDLTAPLPQGAPGGGDDSNSRHNQDHRKRSSRNGSFVGDLGQLSQRTPLCHGRAS